MQVLHVPATVDDFAPAWLTAALREGGLLQDQKVSSCAFSALGAGFGTLGKITRIHLEYDAGGQTLPGTLIAKTPIEDPMGRRIADSFDIYGREITFYRDLQPHIATRVPRHYFSYLAPEEGRYLLLMEDLKDWRSGDQVSGCTLREAECAIREAASLHSTWWGHDWKGPLTSAPSLRAYLPVWQPIIERSWPLFQAKCTYRLRQPWTWTPPEGKRFGMS